MNCTTVLLLVVHLLTSPDKPPVQCKTTASMFTWCTYLPFQQLLFRDVQYGCHSIICPELLEKAVKESSYPPSITCAVMYNEELRGTGRPTRVGLQISGVDPKMEFQCTVYEQIQGD